MWLSSSGPRQWRRRLTLPKTSTQLEAPVKKNYATPRPIIERIAKLIQ